eukprot:CAMPEP_0118685358 /NCGR_PEP_ID=MMETSP0800-20121206/7193_1 /TAXON_ID=210618 ORGANISM="Striatella unipunctata, Strain CCMP2910" /NCGR_SAMPLE_ID=MMETSP0800 /ASSEMBLY_ACC=CAM_ASM_000638 /LENGTH=142 /DNA_ID=CAMNT_0006582243 /DNA_START=206 /DNA_END=634 /DNA_ORIENTATION=+
MRITCRVVLVSKESVVIECGTWSDTKLFIAKVAWFVCESELGWTGVGSFDFRKSQKPGERFLKSPNQVNGLAGGNIGTAICQLDIGSNANARVCMEVERHNSSIDGIARTWADSMLYTNKSALLSRPGVCGLTLREAMQKKG